MNNKRYLRLNDTYSVNYQSTFQDIDPYYRVKLTSILADFQDTVAAFMASRHVAAFDVDKDNILWVISDITFSAGPKDIMWRDEMLYEIRISEISSFRVFFDYTTKTPDGTVCASGTGVWVPVSMETGKPLSISEFCQVGEPANDMPAVKHGKFKYISGNNCILETSYPVTQSELDFNKHMGNRSYIEFAMRGISEEFLSSHYIKNLMVKFEKQTYLGDTVTCRYYKSEQDDNLYLIKLCNSKADDVCVIQVEWSSEPRPIPDIASIVQR